MNLREALARGFLNEILERLNIHPHPKGCGFLAAKV